MTSLIADVLGSSTLDSESLYKRLEKLQIHLEESKSEIVQLIQEQYLEFLPLAVSSARELGTKAESLRSDTASELARLRAQLGDASDTRGSGGKLREQIREVEESLERLGGLGRVSEGLEELTLLSPNTQPRQAANALLRLEQDLHDLEEGRNTDELLDARLLPALREELIVHREALLYGLLEWWKDTFQVSSEGEANEIVVVSGADLSQDRLASLLLLGYSEQKVEQLAKNILENMIKPLSVYQCLLETEPSPMSQTKPSTTLRLRKKEKRVNVSDPLANAVSVLESLMAVSVELESVLREFSFPEESLCSALGRFLSQGIQELVVEGCLRPAIPGDIKKSPEFDVLLVMADKGESKIRGLGLLSGSGSALEEFKAAKESLLIDRRCQKILEKGRSLILSEVNNLVVAGVEKDERNPLESLDAALESGELGVGRAVNEGESLESVKIGTERLIPPVFLFPKCRVSESVVSLVSLVERTLEEAGESGDGAVAGRLLLTARSLLDLFLHLAPAHHQHHFAAIPPFAAAYYNNAYYISHRLLTLGWEVAPKLSPLLGAQECITFIDFIPRLREMAAETLEEHIRSRTRLIEDVLKATQGFRRIVEDHREGECDRGVRGAVLQVEQVGRVWSEVMTPSVYLKSTARLVTALITAITKPILALEDIPAPDSEFLGSLLEGQIPRLERLFDNGNGTEIQLYAENPYHRFKEIIHCLQGSLQMLFESISDRWASGGGPLGVYLTAMEVKALVRALFQNTQRRAAFLASLS